MQNTRYNAHQLRSSRSQQNLPDIDRAVEIPCPTRRYYLAPPSFTFASVADAAFLRIQLRIQDLFVASSITPTDYILGLTLSYIIFSMPGLVLYAIIESAKSIPNSSTALRTRPGFGFRHSHPSSGLCGQ